MINIILNNLTEVELKDFIDTLDIKKFRSDQIFRYIHNKNITNIDEFIQLPISEREILKNNSEVKNIQILEKFKSKIDDTIKLLYLLPDNNIIEGVLMKYKHGYSLCVSTQVGCRMGCSFCASTINGLSRNLEAFEIASQIYEVEKEFNIELSNIVFMGSGEPFDNYENLIKSIRLLNHPKGRNLGIRNMTISTCGVVDKIIEFSNSNIQAYLAVSVHSFKDDIRSKMMPINNKYNISELMNAINIYVKNTNRRISIEYTVIPGENDSDEDIELFKKYTKNLNYIVNLIALNPINDYNKIDYKGKANSFYKKLLKNKINVTLRRELGSDISASCGQLKKSYLKEGGTLEF